MSLGLAPKLAFPLTQPYLAHAHRSEKPLPDWPLLAPRELLHTGAWWYGGEPLALQVRADFLPPGLRSDRCFPWSRRYDWTPVQQDSMPQSHPQHLRPLRVSNTEFWVTIWTFPGSWEQLTGHSLFFSTDKPGQVWGELQALLGDHGWARPLLWVRGLKSFL